MNFEEDEHESIFFFGKVNSSLEPKEKNKIGLGLAQAIFSESCAS